MSNIAMVHSVESCGTVDGPGIRFVVFFQGCPLRCQYCHNPDTWERSAGHEVALEDMLEEIRQYRSYMRFSGGGVTASGGEPLMQPEFLAALFAACHQMGIHTALDTSGHCSLAAARPVLEHTDLVMLDIKSFSPARHQLVTGGELEPTLAMARHLHQSGIPVWVRYVLVPGLTDDLLEIAELSRFLAPMENIRRVEVIPFHKMGEYKWRQMGLEYRLSHTPPGHHRQVERVKELFRQHNLVAP